MNSVKINSSIVRVDLARCGFEINKEKSSWEPERKFSWIGYDKLSKELFSDASSTGCEAFIKGSSFICHRNWSTEESLKSSTWRELVAIKFALDSLEDHLAGRRICCKTDTQNFVRIVQVGSMIKELQDILDIFILCLRQQIQLDVSWVPRNCNSYADFVSKIVDLDDYSVHNDIFLLLEDRWGPHSIDRFACSYSTKLPRFNSRFLQPGTEAVDAFTQDCSSENNWLVPPITLVGRLLSHMRDCKAVGSLIVPMWKSAYFWPLLCNDGVRLNFFVKDWLFLPNKPDLFIKGKAKNNCLVLRHSSPDVWRFVLTLRITVVVLQWVFAPPLAAFVRLANQEYPDVSRVFKIVTSRRLQRTLRFLTEFLLYWLLLLSNEYFVLLRHCSGYSVCTPGVPC